MRASRSRVSRPTPSSGRSWTPDRWRQASSASRADVLRDVEPARYAERVIDGFEADRQGGHGPNALVLAQVGEREFVTVTVWSDWQHVEVATGASIRDPIRTKRGADLVSFVAEHYELLVDLTRS